jgi:hypothetical protein
MPVRHLVNRFLISSAWMLALVAVLFGQVSATEIVGVDVNSGRLLYIQTPRTLVTIANTGTNPDAVILGPYQQIIYALAGAGEVHSFNPYTHTDATFGHGFEFSLQYCVRAGLQVYSGKRYGSQQNLQNYAFKRRSDDLL